MFGIIGAMDEEIKLIKESMQDVATVKIGDVEFHKGQINNQDIILCQSGIGKVNAAFASTILIHHFKVKAILFSGVAGGIKFELNINDLVIGTDFLYHDVDATALGYKLSELPDGYLSLFHADQKLSKIIYDLAVDLFGFGTVYQGRIISGDQFIASFEKIQEFENLYNAAAVDMESTAVAHISNKSNIPCCIIRSISDKADGIANNTYESFFREAAKNSAKIVVELCHQYDLETIFN
ncbi:MAG: 5'-methylthioadenosine/adenosylhomocysteine nucleosidase [Brevinema sp.]